MLVTVGGMRIARRLRQSAKARGPMAPTFSEIFTFPAPEPAKASSSMVSSMDGTVKSGALKISGGTFSSGVTTTTLAVDHGKLKPLLGPGGSAQAQEQGKDQEEG